MKWGEIKKSCPKAHKSFVMAYLNLSKFKTRDLYDFFDAQGIHIEIVTDHTRHGYGVILYAWKIIEWKRDNLKSNWAELERSRSEAENTSFTKAFELLEVVLKERKGK